MRQYKKHILIVVILLVIIPFVVWGGYRGSARAGRGSENWQPETVAHVGKIPLTASEYQERLNQIIQERSRGDQKVTLQELSDDGTAKEVLNQMIDSALVAMNVQKIKLNFDRNFLTQKYKDSERFKEEDGKFSPALWNAFIKSGHANWNAMYEMLQNEVARQIFVQNVTAPVRVLESDVRKQFEDDNTKIQLKFVVIDPKIDVTPEQVKAQYDKDPSKYSIPEQRIADFVAISLIAACPDQAKSIIEKARTGADFAALVKENSQGPDADKGGDIGWIERSSTLPPHQQILNTLGVNEVSEPVEGPGGWYIYKVEEEKTDPATGQISVHVRRIQLKVTLDDAEKQARTQKAEAVLAKAKETGDLAAAAAANGLEVKTTSEFSATTTSIKNVAAEDAYAFRTKVSEVGENGFSDVVPSTSHLYVAKVTKLIAPIPQPFEAVQDKVKDDAINAMRQSPEHADKIKALCDDINKKCKKLQDVVAMYPELQLEIKESTEFGSKEFLYKEGLMAQGRTLVEAAAGKEVGAFFGPVRGFQVGQYFCELAKRTAPSEDAWNNDFPKQEENIRKQLLGREQNKMFKDFLADMRLRAAAETPIKEDQEALKKILERDKKVEKDPSKPAQDLKYTGHVSRRNTVGSDQ